MVENNSEVKKKRKAPNVYVIIFCIILLVAILTWFIPGGTYDLDKAGQAIGGTYKRATSNPQGIWDVLIAPIVGMVGNAEISGAISISLNVMLFGSFLEIMNETGSINIGLRSIAEKYKKNHAILIGVLVFIMAAFGTIMGSYEEGFVYFLMFVPIIVGLGLDTMTALMIVILGTQVGNISSVINPYSTGIASSIAGILPGDGIVFRALLFIVLVILVSFMISRYASKVLKDPKNSYQYHRFEEDKQEFLSDEEVSMSSKQKKVFVVFVLTFVILILALIPWTSLNENWTFFEDAVHWITNVPFLGVVIGKSLVPFGSWYFNEMNVLLLVMSFVAGFIMKYDVDKIINVIIRGAAGLVSTAFIIPMARGIQVIMTNGNITSTILNLGESTLSNLSPVLFVLICLAFYIVLATFIPSSTGLAAATISIMAPLAVFAGLEKTTMIFIFNIALGLVKMIMPTSIIVMTCTQVAHVDYGTWIKASIKPWIAILLVCCGFLIANVLI